MNNALAVFNSLINQCSTTMVIYEYLESNSIPLDSSDLLRWQYVLSVSALDKYIHDIVRYGMIEEFIGNKVETKSYKGVKIDLSIASSIKNSTAPELEFSNEILRQHSFKAFQDPDKISEALSLIWEEKHKWAVISSNMPYVISENDLKTKLKNIVIRRNQIVHEGDCLSTQPPLQQQIISKNDTIDVINFIKDIVNAIENSIL
ncbi:HEPN domain-containing protein [Ruminococcus sp.]|uniref:HEPN domain-containing protein n=1 Tax=Ruminococcus sp. TaxID=41978 RepID=UPI0025D2BA6D|nr:HEPN domain-containing protein [Ruminococcus sp.]